MRRRQFIKASLTGSAMVFAGHALDGIGASQSRQSRLADSRIETLLDEPIGRIAWRCGLERPLGALCGRYDSPRLESSFNRALGG